jgi:hypothetical protein
MPLIPPLRRLPSSVVVHYAALPLSFATILWIGRGQWFFGDDWAILAPHLDASIMLPHVGHWNLIPAIVFQGMRDWLGLGSYLPFLALAVLAHLAVAHLGWRILRRVGANAWVATLLSILVMLLGGASENLLWAFQFGFMGAVALGLAVVLLLDQRRLTPLSCVAIVLLALLAPMFSGTAIPVLAAAAIVGWIRHGFLRTLLLLLPAAVSYLLWFVLIGREHQVASEGITNVGGAFLYAGGMYGGGLGRALPWIGLGLIPAVALVAWFAVTVRRRMLSVAAPAYAMVIGSLVFVALTTWSRSSLGLSASAAQRYAYVTVVLTLPAFGIMLSWVLARSKLWSVTVTLLLVVLIGYNVVLLAVDAGVQAQREAGSRQQILSTLDRVLEHPHETALLSAPADPTWSPDLLGSDLLKLYDAGELRP